MVMVRNLKTVNDLTRNSKIRGRIVETNSRIQELCLKKFGGSKKIKIATCSWWLETQE